MSNFCKYVERALTLLALTQNPGMMRYMTSDEVYALLHGDKE